MATRRPTDAEYSNVDNYVTENERANHSERMTEDDVNDNELPRENNSRDESYPLSETPNGTENENDVTNDLKDTETVSNTGADITVVPGISESGNSIENLSPRGGKYNLRPNPTPNVTDEYRY